MDSVGKEHKEETWRGGETYFKVQEDPGNSPSPNVLAHTAPGLKS